jgi:hypothetical protein
VPVRVVNHQQVEFSDQTLRKVSLVCVRVRVRVCMCVRACVRTRCVCVLQTERTALGREILLKYPIHNTMFDHPRPATDHLPASL